MSVTVLCGDCRDVLAGMEAESFSAIVTDPPAGISFMNRAWDGDKGGRDAWIVWMREIAAECLRVCKPGAHALVWALPRTSHWTAMAWENAGWTVRDRVSHLFASGFPKSLDVSRAIDRARHSGLQDVVRACGWIADRCQEVGLGRKDLDGAAGTSDMGGWWASRLPHRCQIPTLEQWHKLEPLLGMPPDWMRPLLLPARDPGEAWFDREVVGAGISGQTAIWSSNGGMGEYDITAPSTEAARQWQGWGTALKPAMEDWWLLRKPLSESTVAANVLRHGTGALNIEAGRVPTDAPVQRAAGSPGFGADREDGYALGTGREYASNGRWPANLAHDGSPEVMQAFARFGEKTSGYAELGPTNGQDRYFTGKRNQISSCFADTGTAARFFKECRFSQEELRFHFGPKAASWERQGGHPTIKPVELMLWLTRLVCPPSGRLLDPFCGTGSTLVACDWLRIDAVGIEQDAQTCRDAEAKIKRLRARRMLGDAPRHEPLPGQLGLFG